MAEKHNLGRPGNIGYGATVAFLGLFGTTEQVIALVALLRPEIRKRPLTAYLVNIAIANLVMILVSFPTALWSCIIHGWSAGTVACHATGYLAGVTSVTMLATLASAVVKLCQHFHREVNTMMVVDHSDLNSSVKVLIAIWVYSATINLPPLLGWGSIVYEAGETNCAPNWTVKTHSELAYILILTLLGFVLPVITSFVYTYKLHGYFQLLLAANAPIQLLESRAKTRTVITMVMAALVSFVVAWTPYALCALIVAFGGYKIFSDNLSLLPAVFAKSSVLYTPLICCYFNVTIRRSFLKVLRDCRQLCKPFNVQGVNEEPTNQSSTKRPTTIRQVSNSGRCVTPSHQTAGPHSDANEDVATNIRLLRQLSFKALRKPAYN